MEDQEFAEETQGEDVEQQFAALGKQLFGDEFDPTEAKEYLQSKEGFLKRHNDLLTEAGREKQKYEEKIHELVTKQTATPARPNGPVIDPARFARELGVDLSDPETVWSQPVTLEQLWRSVEGVSKWGNNVVHELYGGEIPMDPNERVSLTALKEKTEQALDHAMSTDKTLTGMLEEATIADLVEKHDLADRDDLRKAIDAYNQSEHGEFDSYIETAAQESHKRFEGKLSERATKERARRAGTPATLRASSRGGGIPKGEKEPNPWTQDGMTKLARTLRESASFGE